MNIWLHALQRILALECGMSNFIASVYMLLTQFVLGGTDSAHMDHGGLQKRQILHIFCCYYREKCVGGQLSKLVSWPQVSNWCFGFRNKHYTAFTLKDLWRLKILANNGICETLCKNWKEIAIQLSKQNKLPKHSS